MKHKKKQFVKKKKKKKRTRDDLDEMQVDTGNNVTEATHARKRKKQKKIKEPEDAAAIVTLRQKVPHKRSLYYLEQLILKHELHKQFSFQIEEVNFGIDMTFFKNNEANKFLDFITSVMPVFKKRRDGKQNTEIQYFAAEIAPVCRGDVVCLPQRLYNSLGNIGPLLVCYKVTSSLYFIDPQTLKAAELTSHQFFFKGKPSFGPLFSSKQLVEYTVVDVEKSNNKNGQFLLGDIHVSKTKELGKDNAIFTTKSHLAHILEPGDQVLGYDIKNANLNDEAVQSYKHIALPDIILVQKVYERPKKRYWTLKTWKIKHGDDYDQFLDELEEDKEMRSKINLYKDPNFKGDKMDIQMKDNVPHVGLEELLEGLTIN